MKKVLCIVSALLMLLTALSLTACNKDDQKVTTTAAATPTDTESLPVGNFSETTTYAGITSVPVVSTTISNIISTTRAIITTTRAVIKTTKPVATTTKKAVPVTTAKPVTTTKPTTTLAPTTTAPVENALFSSFTSKDINGKDVNQNIFKGNKLTMVVSWKTTDPEINTELKSLAEISSEYASKGVKVVGIVTDADSSTTKSDARDIIKASGVDFTNIVLSDSLESTMPDELADLRMTIFTKENGSLYAFVKDGENLNSYQGSKSKSEWTAIIDAALADLDKQ